MTSKVTDFCERDYTPMPTTECKHGRKEKCEKCGTSGRRDAQHTTYDGKGKVGQLIARAKKKR